MLSSKLVATRSQRIALVSVSAVLYALLRIIPIFPMIVPRATFSLSDVVASLLGVLLGPSLGVFSIIIGTFLGAVLGKALIFTGLDFLPAAVNALLVGLLIRERRIPSAVIYGTLLVLFVVHPYTLRFVLVAGIMVPFNWMHAIGFLILLSPLSKRASVWLKSGSAIHLTAALAILTSVGTLGQHLMGGLLTEVLFGNVLGSLDLDSFRVFWSAIFWLYPIERGVIIVVSALIGVPLISTLRRSKLVV